MDFNKLINITGKPGLYEIKTEKGNGVIVKSLLNGKSNFISIQTHSFSVLSNIAIYTTTDAEPLEAVYKKMIAMEEEGKAVIDIKSSNDKEIRAYFKEVLPEHDENQVYISDIKKLVKWYLSLKEKDMLHFEEKEEETGEGETEATAEVTEKKK